MHRMITVHARPRQTDGRTNIMAIARRFVLTNASTVNKLNQVGNDIRQSSIRQKFVFSKLNCCSSKRRRHKESGLKPVNIADCLTACKIYDREPEKYLLEYSVRP